tara:strand:- start:3017 stop:3247 length:231 start_codon:yes stop_codon:yes gene_type:complete
MTIIDNLIKSFTTEKGGFAARKLTAFALMILIAYSHFKYVDLTNVVEVLIIDLSGVLLCLGLVTAEQILSFKKWQK